MANLTRNMIELVTDVQGDEIKTEKYWTPVFLPMSVTYEAIDMMEEIDKSEENKTGGSEKDLIDQLVDFVASKIYGGQFTKEQLLNGLHAPSAITTLQQQIQFIAQGEQTSDTKKFLEKKN